VAIGRFVGVDLAWAQRTDGRDDNETGLVALDAGGRVVAADWCRGVPAAVDWLTSVVGSNDAYIFIDASLIVTNAGGQRLCETQVGQRYGKWKVSANSTNLASKHRAGIELLARLEALGWCYDSGLRGPAAAGVRISECYPYTTLVGTPELAYCETERPLYKRMPRRMPIAEWRPLRAQRCDELIARLAALASADPPLHLEHDPCTRALIEQPSPLNDRDYKHREDLIDAALAAWTALVWRTHGVRRCQVLGPSEWVDGREATIVAPAISAQRR
jgi:predicted RNase H-like nuclease